MGDTMTESPRERAQRFRPRPISTMRKEEWTLALRVMLVGALASVAYVCCYGIVVIAGMIT